MRGWRSSSCKSRSSRSSSWRSRGWMSSSSRRRSWRRSWMSSSCRWMTQCQPAQRGSSWTAMMTAAAATAVRTVAAATVVRTVRWRCPPAADRGDERQGALPHQVCACHNWCKLSYEQAGREEQEERGQTEQQGEHPESSRTESRDIRGRGVQGCDQMAVWVASMWVAAWDPEQQASGPRSGR